ncbi:hypothetical protein [Anatilimnocola floriformis]|uniref:hypothetical protein n=1 Tax=Anatilimnocola floriformis TaxID=2948575 RepID=UPI0020C54A31|nr:hypothetical protein [Anatilimnocola floriformis]
MNSIDLAVGALAATLRLAAGTSLVIRRGGERSEPIIGTLTVTSYDVLDEETNLPLRVNSSDWVIEKSLIVVGGKSIELRPGDELLAGSRRFEVFPIPKRPCVEPHDASGLMVVVHSKEI